jgi:hypothetical protein
MKFLGAAAGAAPSKLSVYLCRFVASRRYTHELAADEQNFLVTFGILAQKISICGNLFWENFLSEKISSALQNFCQVLN